MSTDIPFSDYLAIRNIIFEWAESYDTKDWERLKKVLGPSIRMDFRPLRGELKENLTPADFAAVVSDKKVIGDPRVKSQHLLGAARWDKLDDGSITVEHQARVGHQRYKEEDLAEVVNHGHGHGTVQHTVRKLDGAWKIVGYKPKVDWIEYDLFGTINPDAAAA